MGRSRLQNDLGLDELRLALSIIEGSSLKVTGTRLLGAGADRFRRLRDLGALVRKERASTIICQECDRRHRATVHLDRECQAMTYFCSEVGLVTVEDGLLDVYEFQLDWLLTWVAKALRIALKQRPIPRMEDHLWELGETAIEGCRVRILCARRIGSPKLLEGVEQRLLPLAAKGKTGVVLTATPGFEVSRRLPSAFSVVDIEQLIDVAQGSASIDRRRLLQMVEAEATVDRYKTGSAGRPTSKDLICQELKNRIDAGEALLDRGAEAEHLKSWLAINHPEAPQPTIKTILNTIASDHRAYRFRMSPHPK